MAPKQDCLWWVMLHLTLFINTFLLGFLDVF